MRCSKILVLGLVTLLAGCATSAQRQYQTIQTGNRSIIAQGKACAETVYNSPEAAPVRPHYPWDAREATLAQLSDSSLATKPEIAAVLSLHPRLKACQKAILEGMLTTTPSAVPILAKEYSAADDDVVLLVQRKMPWGELTKRRRDRVLAAQTELQAEGQRITAGLERQHENELARRQAAAEALARWSQTQQMIDAANRPVITNCTRFGGSTNCVSR
jgi:hypothetical protein